MTAAVSLVGAPCEHVRYTTREGKGPRGGRRTWTTATCVRCKHSGSSLDPRAGSPSHAEARRALRKHGPCGAPRAVPEAERRLRALAIYLRDGTSVSLPFAVEWLPFDDEAVQRAWQECRNGYVMGLALNAHPPEAFVAETMAYRLAQEDPDGQRATVLFERPGGLHAHLSGPHAEVANALRALVPRLEWQRGGAK